MLDERRVFRAGICISLALCLAPAAGLAQVGSTLPIPPAPFAGKIAPGTAESVPAFPKPLMPAKAAPNVLLILTDDVGFAAESPFGGPIPAPHLDRLARDGLVYNRFNTTAMCSPTRAAVLTGRNHHAVATGTVLDFATGYPGYWSIIPKSAATVGEVLRDNGYSTAWFGKNHNTPGWERSLAGPFDHWPTGLGFDYFYGFMAAETNQWTPTLYRDTAQLPTPRDPGYILDRDLADDAIRWIHNQKAGAPDRPFFIYYATGSGHSPHHAPQDWIDRFKGKFDQGWDKVRGETFQREKALGIIPADAVDNPRPEGLPAWNSLTQEQKVIYARFMEVYAGVLAYQDDQIGRVIEELRRMGQLDNTLVMFIEGDNGASAEGGLGGTLNEMGHSVNGAVESQDYLRSMLDKMGGPETYEHYPSGWAWAMNTPFQLFKSYASHLGGVRNGLIVSWPDGIKTRGVRSQFHHVVDIMPTILEAAHVTVPNSVNGVKQQPMSGVSMLYSFDHPDAPDRHHVQYFEMLGNRAIYQDGWLANTTPKRPPWGGLYKSDGHADTSYGWELYDLAHDYSQSRNVAAEHADKLKALQVLFDKEAKANNVYPLDDNLNLDRFHAAAKAYESPNPVYEYWGPDISVGNEVMPPILGRSFAIDADIVIPQSGGADGVLVAAGSKFGGWAFFLKSGVPVALQSMSPQAQYQFRIAGSAAIPPGPARIHYDFAYDGGGLGRGGTMTISVNGQQVASGRIDRTINLLAERDDTFDIGFDAGTPVSDEYADGGRFTGEIRKVTVTIKGADPLAGQPRKPERSEKVMDGQ